MTISNVFFVRLIYILIIILFILLKSKICYDFFVLFISSTMIWHLLRFSTLLEPQLIGFVSEVLLHDRTEARENIK